MLQYQLAHRGFDPRTFGLWAQHASSAPVSNCDIVTKITIYKPKINSIRVIFVHPYCIIFFIQPRGYTYSQENHISGEYITWQQQITNTEKDHQ